MKRLLVVFIILMVNHVYPQEWSPEQKEVLRDVGNFYELMSKNKIEEAVQYIHKDISSWPYDQEIPIDYEMGLKIALSNIGKSKIMFFKIFPVEIKVLNDVSVIHYLYTEFVELENGDTKLSNYKYTAILVKEDDKWKEIAGHGGPI